MTRLFEKINSGEVYIIAEMSANHGGSLENAKKIVQESAAAGADCLKIQTYTADSLTIDCDKPEFMIHGTLWDGNKLYDLYKNAGTPYEWQEEIKNECEKCGIDFLSTPFDQNAVDFLEEIGCEQYKIASFELVDIPLIEYTASKGKPMIISCGMGSASEIEEAINACRRVGNEKIVLLKCCSEYPANWKDMHLANIPDMKKRFEVPVGLSDHSEGYLAAVVGVSLGACVVEKHVKLEGVKSADSEFSMSMHEFGLMVKAVKDARTIYGGVSYGPTEGEKDLLHFRRSLFAVKDIARGEKITNANVRSIRPCGGMKPVEFANIIGKEASCDIAFGTPIDASMISDFHASQNANALTAGDLYLEEITKEDTDLIVRFRSDPNDYRFFCNPKALTKEGHINWFENSYLKNPDRIDWIARQKKDGQAVGVFSAKRESVSSKKAEISYLSDPAFRKKGYAKAAVLAIMEFCKKKWNCEKAIAVIHKENHASIGFIEALGFTKSGEYGLFFEYERKMD